ncbi:MAG: hypothetical protein ABF443_00155 [Acetobacter malorum]|uniref:hypothetical protein n=1 Tax=Acetobacter malorum TaxID=178901 RepID=UPI0039E96061
MARKSAIDWAAVETDFRAGRQSNRQLSEKYSVSESAIRKRASAEGWVRTIPCTPPLHLPIIS